MWDWMRYSVSPLRSVDRERRKVFGLGGRNQRIWRWSSWDPMEMSWDRRKSNSSWSSIGWWWCAKDYNWLQCLNWERNLDLDEIEEEMKDWKCWESTLTRAEDKLKRKGISKSETRERGCLHWFTIDDGDVMIIDVEVGCPKDDLDFS